MAFVKKTWKDRIAEFPTRRRLTKEDNTSELVTVAREEGTLSQEGDAFSAENMNDLENRIDAEFTEVNGKLLNIVYKDIFQYGTTEKNIKEITNISLFGTYLVTAYVKLAGNGRKTHVKIKLNEIDVAVTDGNAHIKLNVEGDMNVDELKKITKLSQQFKLYDKIVN